jgi:hypothetical protein
MLLFWPHSSVKKTVAAQTWRSADISQSKLHIHWTRNNSKSLQLTCAATAKNDWSDNNYYKIIHVAEIERHGNVDVKMSDISVEKQSTYWRDTLSTSAELTCLVIHHLETLHHYTNNQIEKCTCTSTDSYSAAHGQNMCLADALGLQLRSRTGPYLMVLFMVLLQWNAAGKTIVHILVALHEKHIFMIILFWVCSWDAGLVFILHFIHGTAPMKCCKP